MNFPTALTLLRFILVVPVVVAFEATRIGTPEADPTWAWAAFACFVIAATTDWFDGYFARKWNQTTALGALLDPLADKVLVAAALIGLTFREIVPAWSVTVILAREFLVTGLRVSIAEAGGGVMPASWASKVKASAQQVAVALYLWPSGTLEWLAHMAYGLALILTVTSGIEYVAKTRTIWSPK